METRRGDEERDDHKHPPEKSQDGEEDGEDPRETDTPEVVRGDGRVVGGQIRGAVEAVGQEAGVFIRSVFLVRRRGWGAGSWPAGAGGAGGVPV